MVSPYLPLVYYTTGMANLKIKEMWWDRSRVIWLRTEIKW